ncbi:helix-turn-helix transcriptional regulator [Chitinophaga pendula]|uniref:helix-turn-helix domain-containing protein n=1 Tax=Chitinophaga TaxID=79328 RepID=UPI0012FD5073|nr:MULTISPECIES: helix-turn-helix domain-containing protein [Chitinophaga]UCJ06503.1 helix-turn-helix transcriptional regulator [Chitinophaga pendula]
MLVHILCGNTSGGCAKEAVPATALCGIVERYYWYEHQQEGTVWATLDGQPVLLFLLDAPYQIQFTGKYQVCMHDAFCCSQGLRQTYITGLSPGMRILAVKFSCTGLSMLMPGGNNMGGLSPLAPIYDLWGTAGRALTVALRESSTVMSQRALLDQFLVEQLSLPAVDNHMLHLVVSRIRSKRGLLSVQHLCSELRLNYKWLERNFRRHLGTTPKRYIDTIRFLHAYLKIQEGGDDLVQIAYESGYYDHHHFVKVCRQHTGYAPSRLLSLA